ncbi:hypothetical protein TSMEX_007613, partial [Taenia solium]
SSLSRSMSFGFKLFLTIPTAILCVAFIAIFMIGIFMEVGVYLKANVVQSLLSDFEVHPNESTKFASSVLNNDHTGAVVMAIGFFMFLVSLFTIIYGLNGREKRLYNCSAISMVVLASEAIALAVFFSDPYKLTTSFMEALQHSLGQYEFKTELNYIWSRIMWAELECSGRFHGVCCGMNNFTDFHVGDNGFPGACCHSNGDRCTIEEVQTAHRPGCRDKLFACTAAHSRHVMSITFATLLLLVSYIPLFIVSFNNNGTGELKVAHNVFFTSQNAVMALPITHTFLSSLKQPEG